MGGAGFHQLCSLLGQRRAHVGGGPLQRRTASCSLEDRQEGELAQNPDET